MLRQAQDGSSVVAGEGYARALFGKPIVERYKGMTKYTLPKESGQNNKVCHNNTLL